MNHLWVNHRKKYYKYISGLVHTKRVDETANRKFYSAYVHYKEIINMWRIQGESMKSSGNC